ncbi:type I secretion system permease/ATPase [Pantoea sp. SIMBA_079]|uniref:type I secretion system permease/ATPase n=1 Tax=Pantoea sp. SIMBA_079 TaxID=3085817 RepID=UPI0028DCE4EE|nr:type I secretion system permease/ATPase [uncultured Pantoea sp.]
MRSPSHTRDEAIAALDRAAAVLGIATDRRRLQLQWLAAASPQAQLTDLAQRMGLVLQFVSARKLRWRQAVMPLLLRLNDGTLALAESADEEGRVQYWLSAGGDGVRSAPLSDLLAQAQPEVGVITLAARARDVRMDTFVRPWQPHWFWQHFRPMKRRLAEISLASLVSNLLALAGILFSMQVYDRVIPARSQPTLWVLFSGVLLAALMEYLIRLARTRVADGMGKRIDLALSAQLFARALRIRNEARPRSTGAFIAQLREVEQVRELLTSTTVSAAADIPFVVLFLFILSAIGGWLVLVPLLAIPLIVIPGLLVQIPMARLAKQGQRESALRQALLVETLEGVEDIKALQAEAWFQRQWEQTHEVSATLASQQRLWGARLTGWAGSVQQLTYAGMLVAGVYLILNNQITTGTLVASSLLSARTLAPLMQLTLVFSRWQHARSAMTGLNELLKKPVDQPQNGMPAYAPVLSGHYQLQQVRYHYDENSLRTIAIDSLTIRPGERIAILGGVGAGKSTLLKILAGQAMPVSGRIMIDGVSMQQLDPADLRRQLGWLSQEARLFFGTLRQNLLLGNPHATEQEMLQALRISGALSLLQQDAAALDRLIHEGGRGLSGGQRQMILLSRMLLRQPQIVLLDEPTAALDEPLEAQVIRQLAQWLPGRTLVLVTHRPALLGLVDRIIVMKNGEIVADGPRDAILQRSTPQPEVADEHG